MTFKLTLNQGTLNISKHHNEALVTTDGLSNKDTGEGGSRPELNLHPEFPFSYCGYSPLQI